MSLSEDLLDENPDSQAVEADIDEEQYTPEPESNLVIVEPEVISVGRGKRKKYLRQLSPEQR